MSPREIDDLSWLDVLCVHGQPEKGCLVCRTDAVLAWIRSDPWIKVVEQLNIPGYGGK